MSEKQQREYKRLHKLGTAKVSVTLTVKGLTDLIGLASRGAKQVRQEYVDQGHRPSEIAASVVDWEEGGLAVLHSPAVMHKRQMQSYLRLSAELRKEETVE